MLSPKTYGTCEKIILSVEDDNATSLLLEIGLTEAGGDYTMYRVQYGVEAMAFLRRSAPYGNVPKPNLVLLDLNMPGISGLEILKMIKGDPTLSDIPCVVFSSSKLESDRATCLALGARAFVTKPTNLDGLFNALRKIFAL